MASTSSGGKADGEDASKKKSIVIVDMPEELINREILKNHFEKFGTVERLACSVSKKYAVIHFSTAAEAQNAAANGTKIRPEGPHLKIFNRAIGTLGQSKPAEEVPTASGSRVVTRRKIVRTFNSASGSGVTTSFVKEPVVVGKSEPATSSTVDETDNAPGSDGSVGPSSSGYPPLKSSVKISRPSPFLRKRPSFGDKTLKPSSNMNRNPFALPPRSKLSLDRRKISSHKSNLSGIRQGGLKSSGLESSEDSSKVDESSHVVESACSSSEIILPDEDENDEPNTDLPESKGGEEPTCSTKVSTESTSNAPEVEPTSTLDIDETTEDAILNDDDDAADAEDPLDEHGGDQENVFVEGETDTQDTAEVSTEEEEGEIQDDEEDEEGEEDEEQIEENEEEEIEDVYESPLKRAEETAASSKDEPSSSSRPFSFQLSSAKSSQGSSSGPSSSSSLFKLPFTSPFAFGDAPKPFSSSSFGLQLNASNMSKIFAGGPSTTSPNTPSSKSKGSELSKEKSKPTVASSGSSTPPPIAKKDNSAEPEKPKAPPFGLFSSLSSAFSTSKPSSSSSGSSLQGSSKETKQSSSAALKSLSSLSSSASQIPKKTPVFGMPSAAGFGTSSSTAPVTQAQHPQSQRDSPNPLLLSFNPDTVEAQKLFSERSNTVEERYRILEARDKLIRARIPKTKVNVEHATKLIGTCPDMCPEKERYMRQFQRQLVPYEMVPGQDHVVDHQKAIKVYSRSSADQEEPLPHELRPGPTLDFTMHYLLRYIVPLGDNPDENLSDWYNFLWDRTRSIRKDITQQQIIDLTAVSLYEKCARFHIHCASRLCELDVHSFDPKLNDENLMKCLQSLEHLYEDLRRRQTTCPNEPEFRAYQIMMNLNEGDALYNAQQLPGWILNSPEVQTALKLHHSIYTKNFVAFFRSVETLSYMTSCILHRYFFQVRSLALRCFIKAHCTLPKYETAIPINTLQRMLGYGSAVQSFSYLCEAHGIHCDIDENRVILKRKLFYLPEFPSIYRETHLIDSKLRTSVAEAINGGPLPNIDFANHKPRSSFNENGQLIPGDIISSGTQQESGSTTFVPPESISSSRLFSKSIIQPSVSSSGFSFSSIFSQPKKEPAPVPKPVRQIESVCQAATAKLIEESVKQDVERLSQARLEEAKRIQEQAARRRLREQIVAKLSNEFVERAISQHVDTVVRIQSASRIRQFRAIDEVSKNTADILIDESVLINLGISARTELILAKEYHHRLIRNLQRIFQRIRARFAVERWVRYTKAAILKREKEEEKRREELWNFPVINSYAMSTKDVFKAFCGNSPVQPSLSKIESLSAIASPEALLSVRPGMKRKSEGDSDKDVGAPTRGKVLRMNAEENDNIQQTKLKQMWEFPAVNPYSRTNRQVLEAFCGKSAVVPSLPVVTTVSSPAGGEKRKSDGVFSLSSPLPFKIHRPAERVDVGRGLGKEIRNKANESDSDLLNSIQKFLATIKDEEKQLQRLEPYKESVEVLNKSCPEIMNVSAERLDQLQDEEDSESELYKQELSYRNRSHILSGAFIEEENLLNQIQKFVREVRDEKAKSWKTDTFLNEIDLSIIS